MTQQHVEHVEWIESEKNIEKESLSHKAIVA